jgi:hypothetical protein
VRLHPFLRLVRPALAPTAAADVLAGAAFGGGAPLIPLIAAAAGSVLLYSAGMVQNDLCDRKRDAKLHPDRPLVTKPGLVSGARWLTAFLYAGGLALAATAGAFWPALGVVACANAYNLGAKRKFPWDALVLGASRACNLLIGLSLATGDLSTGGAITTYALAYLFFIAGITGASRAEDLEPVQTRRLALLLSILPMLLALVAVMSISQKDRIVALLPFALLLYWLVRAMVDGSRPAVMRYVFRCLMTIFVFHAVCLWGAGAGVSGLVAILVCASLSFVLRGALTPARPAD